jgi:hypothetical protein
MKKYTQVSCGDNKKADAVKRLTKPENEAEVIVAKARCRTYPSSFVEMRGDD